MYRHGNKTFINPTCHCQLSTGDVWATNHTVVALVLGLTLLDLQDVAVTNNADVILVITVKLLCCLVPGQGNLRVVDLDLTLKHRCLVFRSTLVFDVLH